MIKTQRIAGRLALAASLLAAGGQASAQQVTEQEFWSTGMEYILSEYALDTVAYTSCAMTLAKMREPANFEKVKREFIEVFPPELRPKAEQVFYGNDMAEVKAKVAERGVMKAIDNAKRSGQNMARACENGIRNLINLNETARKDWNALKVRLK